MQFKRRNYFFVITRVTRLSSIWTLSRRRSDCPWIYPWTGIRVVVPLRTRPTSIGSMVDSSMLLSLHITHTIVFLSVNLIYPGNLHFFRERRKEHGWLERDRCTFYSHDENNVTQNNLLFSCGKKIKERKITDERFCSLPYLFPYEICH